MSRTGLIVVDMINAYDFPDAEKLVRSAREAVPVIQELIAGADGPVIYVDDNFGQWRSNRDELLQSALDSGHGDLVEPIRPDDDALFGARRVHPPFEVRVPRDAVAHIHEELAEAALTTMERNMSADVTPARGRGCRRR